MSLEDKRVVYAPQPGNISTRAAILNVNLNNDEVVEWHWTHPNGQSVITRYKIVKKNDFADQKNGFQASPGGEFVC